MELPFLKSPAERRLYHELALLNWFDAAALPKVPLPQPQPRGRLLVRFFLPRFTHPYGGVYTALRLADAVNRAGSRAEVVVYDDPDFDAAPLMSAFGAELSTLKAEHFLPAGKLSALKQADVAVATFWPSCYRALGSPAIRRVYLVQDYEPAFYPAGVEFALAQNTYQLPFDRLYNTPGLKEFVEARHPLPGSCAYAFTPAVSPRFCPRERREEGPLRALFYARPGAARNGFALCFALARAIKERCGGSVQCVCAGEALSPKLQSATRGAWRFAGVTPYERLPAFYASFDVAVSYMFTAHPSYIPFEAMASGCAVLTNHNPANAWFFRPGENCLAAGASVSAQLSAFLQLTDAALRARIAAGGERTVRQTTWEKELAGMLAFLGVKA